MRRWFPGPICVASREQGWEGNLAVAVVCSGCEGSFAMAVVCSGCEDSFAMAVVCSGCEGSLAAALTKDDPWEGKEGGKRGRIRVSCAAVLRCAMQYTSAACVHAHPPNGRPYVQAKS